MEESDSNNLFNLTQYIQNMIIYHVTSFHCGVRTGPVLLLEPSSAGPSRFQVLSGPAHLLVPTVDSTARGLQAVTVENAGSGRFKQRAQQSLAKCLLPPGLAWLTR